MNGVAAALECAFGNDDNAETFTQAFASHDGVRDLSWIVRNFGNEDDVRAARNSGVDGNPSGVSAHDLDHDHAPVALRGRVEFVKSIAGGVHGSVEAERDDGPGNIVIDRLGDANERYTLLVKFLRDGERSIAADDD